MTRTITYFSIIGYEEDGTEEYKVVEWKCYDEEEFEYALENIYEGCIISIE